MKMKLTPDVLKRMVSEELSKSKLLGGAKDPSDVDAIELDADEFGTNAALEKPEKRDHSLQEAYNMIRSLNAEERRLVNRLKKVREQKVLHAKRLIAAR